MQIRWQSLTAGLIMGATFAFLNVNVANPIIDPWENELGGPLYVLSACTLLPAILGFGMKYLTIRIYSTTRQSPALPVWAEASKRNSRFPGCGTSGHCSNTNQKVTSRQDHVKLLSRCELKEISVCT